MYSLFVSLCDIYYSNITYYIKNILQILHTIVYIQNLVRMPIGIIINTC